MTIHLPCRIDVFLYEGVNLLDVSGPVQAFEEAQIGEKNAYETRFVSMGGKPVRASCGLKLVPDGKFGIEGVGNDLLIPGGAGVDALLEDGNALNLIRKYANGQGRIISICSGAILLAAAGVLNGLEATTHWARVAQTKAFPNVDWDLDRIHISQGRVFTSAGVTTGIDLALAIIQADCGPVSALAVARELIVQLRRTGGQSQYTFHLAGQFAGNDLLAGLIERIVSQPQLDWSLESMAEAAGMNTRTLTRHFKRDLENTPANFVEKVRIDYARALLLEDMPLKRVASESGFGDLQRMRRAFQRHLGVQVSEYRAMFA